MDVAIKILQFICSFTLLVMVHEMGHLLLGKLFGVRVEEFRIFFGKAWFKRRWGETEYGIGWLPFGGYAKLAGMVDESMDTEQLKSAPQPWEFRSKPAWQRLLIILGGVMMNAILAFVIYVGISLAWGDRYISNSQMPYGYVYSDYAKALGFEDGDKIVSIAGTPIEDYARILPTLIIEEEKSIVVLRNGEELTIDIPVQSVMELSEQTDFLTPRLPFVVANVVEGMGAAEAGLRSGDEVVGVDGQEARFYDQIAPALLAHAGDTIGLTLLRDGAPVECRVVVSAEGQIGVGLASAEYIPVANRSYTLLEAIPRGAERVVEEMRDYWKQLKMIVRPQTEMYRALGGPIAIGGIFPNEWNWEHFWKITALLSVVLAIMNVLPIPALDGGHALFIVIEMLTGRRPSDKVMMVAQAIGMTLLLLLMFYATANDITRLFR
ncbi:MAG: RIP metalloprotease RseP [Tidjanibacter sp.]|nr:RIP metalloprotease RseP [Tidjanibacter sp.]